jgi:hypothetical protein
MNFTAEFVLQIMVAIAGGLGAYAAIRADLARLHERTTQTQDSTNHAHRRIDDMLGHR